MNDLLKPRVERAFAGLRMEFCGDQGIEINGQRLVPDESKGYVEFQISHGLNITAGPGGPTIAGVTAYRTAMHPQTVLNSHGSMLHQVFNLGHLMRRYDPEKISRDHIIGSIVAVEHPPGPWTVTGQQSTLRNGAKAATPQIRAVAVIHKTAQDVPKLLAEHLGAKHQWTVSHEVRYIPDESGFLVGNRANAKKSQEEMLANLTPEEFSAAPGFGYVPFEQAPDDLKQCYNEKKTCVDKDWNGLPVVLLKGGMNGNVHFQGVGAVRYGAEREAAIQSMLAGDPNSLSLLEEEGVLGLMAAGQGFLAAAQAVVAGLE